MFYLLSVNLALWMVRLFCLRGAYAALWSGWLISMLLMPTWALIPVGAFVLDLRTVAAVLGLAGLWWSQGLPVGRILVADVVVILLALIQIVSEALAGDFGALSGPEIVRLWLLPYLVGRFFLGQFEDLRKVQPYLCVVVLLVCLYGIAEAILKVNVLNWLFGVHFGFLEASEGFRWGLKRAQGFLKHPIYLGYLLVLFLPWIMEARRESLAGEGPVWWRYLPFLTAGCLLATASRGPLLAALACGASYLFFRKPDWRLPIAGLALLMATLLLAFDEHLLEAVAQFGGEGDAARAFALQGEEVQYSGSRHRILLFRAYEEPLSEVGLFGFGSHLQGIDLEAIPSLFYSIDNHYLRFLLQFGYGALGLFLLLAGVTVYYTAQSARCCSNPESRFAAYLCGALSGVSVMLFSVWFAPDFGWAWLFCAGLASNLRVLRLQEVPTIAAPRVFHYQQSHGSTYVGASQ